MKMLSYRLTDSSILLVLPSNIANVFVEQSALPWTMPLAMLSSPLTLGTASMSRRDHGRSRKGSKSYPSLDEVCLRLGYVPPNQRLRPGDECAFALKSIPEPLIVCLRQFAVNLHLRHFRRYHNLNHYHTLVSNDQNPSHGMPCKSR